MKKKPVSMNALAVMINILLYILTTTAILWSVKLLLKVIGVL